MPDLTSFNAQCILFLEPIMTKKESKTTLKDLEPFVPIHLALIYMENKLNLKQRQAWFYLVHKALPDLKSQKTFSVSLAELKQAIDYKSLKNNQVLIDALKELKEISIQTDIFNAKTTWPQTTLLSKCSIKKNSGVCKYSFSPFLTEMLLKPEACLKLSLPVVRAFNGKHSLALYTLLLSRIDFGINYGEQNLTLEQIRLFLGLDDSDYQLPGDINKRIIQSALKEINQVSDMNINIQVIRGNYRKIKGFHFTAQIKRPFLVHYKTETPVKEEKTKILHYTDIQKPVPKKVVTKASLNPTVSTQVEEIYAKRLLNLYNTEKRKLFFSYLEENFEKYRDAFEAVVNRSVKPEMLRNIISRNNGRKDLRLLTLSQTIADYVYERTSNFDFDPVPFEFWKEELENNLKNKPFLLKLKQEIEAQLLQTQTNI